MTFVDNLAVTDPRDDERYEERHYDFDDREDQHSFAVDVRHVAVINRETARDVCPEELRAVEDHDQ